MHDGKYLSDQPVHLLPCGDGPDIGNGVKNILLLRYGETQSSKGSFVIDDEAGALIVEEFSRQQVDLVIDYEHQSIYATDGPAPARAAGWIKKLWFESGKGVFGLVEWLSDTIEIIRSKQYKYLSPVVILNPDDRKVVSLQSVGLTNLPAIVGAEPLAASRKTLLEKPMNLLALNDGDVATGEQKIGELKKVLEKKGVKIGDGADFVDILNAAIALLEGRDPNAKADAETVAATARVVMALADGNNEVSDLLTKLGDALKIEKPRDVKQILEAALEIIAKQDGTDVAATDSQDAAIAASVRERLDLAPDANKSEVMLTLTTLQSHTESQHAFMKADERVEFYLKKAVLNKNDGPQMAAAIDLARENPERFETLMANLRPFVEQGRTTPPNATKEKRIRVMNKAKSDYLYDKQMRKLTSFKAYTNMMLKDAGCDALSDEEATRLERMALSAR